MLNRQSWRCDSTSRCECFMHFPAVADAAPGELEQNILERARHFVLLTCFQSHVSVLQWRGVTRPLGAEACPVFKSVCLSWQTLFVLVTTCWTLHLQLLAEWWLVHCWCKNAQPANRALSLVDGSTCCRFSWIGRKAADGGSTSANGADTLQTLTTSLILTDCQVGVLQPLDHNQTGFCSVFIHLDGDSNTNTTLQPFNSRSWMTKDETVATTWITWAVLCNFHKYYFG